MPDPRKFNTIPDVMQAAKANTPGGLWYFSGSGPESEVTVRRNRAVFDRLAFQPRVGRDVSRRDLSTSFLGFPLSMPLMLAPIGYIGSFHRQGAQAPARVAQKAGTISWVATNSMPSLEETRSVTKGPIIFQLYLWGDQDWQHRMLQRAENAGYDAVCLTLDSASAGRRDRYLPMGWGGARNEGPHPNLDPMGEGPGAEAARGEERSRIAAGFTWSDLERIRDHTRLPVITKGIMHPADAVAAVEHGSAAVYVSNHGGRRQDHVLSTMEVLPQIIKQVDKRVPVLVDSGFMRGTDVVKALAMGADAVLIGKLVLWALAAGDEPALERTLDILRGEVDATVANLGASRVSELCPDMVVPSFIPPAAPWPVEPMWLAEP